MKYIPILFSTPMIQALLDGRKTQTRRILKPQPPEGYMPEIEYDHFGVPFLSNRKSAVLLDTRPAKMKYKPSDILWVRETWRRGKMVDDDGSFTEEVLQYAADGHDPVHECDGDGFQVFKKDGSAKLLPWKPSLFMPKEACRIFLKVKSVRVEQLNDISETDAIAEGIELESCGRWKDYYYKDVGVCLMATTSYFTLWQSINKDFDPINDNPWVWVIEFERVARPAEFLL